MSKKKRKSPPWKRNEAVVFVVDWYSLVESPPPPLPPLIKGNWRQSNPRFRTILFPILSPSHSFQHSRLLFASPKIFLIGENECNAVEIFYFIHEDISFNRVRVCSRSFFLFFFFATSVSVMIRFKIPDNFNRIVSKTYWEDRFSRSICFPRLSTLFTTLSTFE